MSSTNQERQDAPALRRALAAIQDLRGRLELAERGAREPIAIVGLGCRLPGGEDPSAFSDLLQRGESAIREIPSDRWDMDAYYDPDPDRPGKMYIRHGGFLSRVDEFEPRFFEISPREAVTMDPQQRLLLEVGWEALEDAGIDPSGLRGVAGGVFFGVAGNPDYGWLLPASTDSAMDAFTATGVAPSIAAGRVSYALGLRGPAMTVDTACSSSLVAIHLAMQSLRRGECDLALAGGAMVMLFPDAVVSLCRARMLAFDGRCKTFDAAADGYARGEGCGVVVLKRLKDARAAGDRVIAILRGAAVNQDGRSSGLTAPNGAAQEALIRAALKDAGVSPRAVSYLEAHGTGTRLGDPIEVRAMQAVFGPDRPPDSPLMIGSVKTNIGHLEAAAGVAGLLKVVTALQRGRIPPHLNFKTPNPDIDWDAAPIEVASGWRAVATWRRTPNGRSRRVRLQRHQCLPHCRGGRCPGSGRRTGIRGGSVPVDTVRPIGDGAQSHSRDARRPARDRRCATGRRLLHSWRGAGALFPSGVGSRLVDRRSPRASPGTGSRFDAAGILVPTSAAALASLAVAKITSNSTHPHR